MTTTTSMPRLPPLPPLTLIVATTPSLGIGFRNTLPWPRLHADLAFFARVTKRAPPPPPPSPTSHTPACASKTKNAVIMGRKTWDSLPPTVRPLKGRINVVVSRNPQALHLPGNAAGQEPVIPATSIEDGLRKLQATYPPPLLAAARSPSPPPPSDLATAAGAMSQGAQAQMLRASQDSPRIQSQLAPPPPSSAQISQAPQDVPSLGRVFVIGGAEIYKSAVGMEACERILWTRVGGEWECDVFFPGGVLPVGGGGSASGEERWVVGSNGELEAWVGEEGVGGLRREGEVEFEVRMVERVRG